MGGCTRSAEVLPLSEGGSRGLRKQGRGCERPDGAGIHAVRSRAGRWRAATRRRRCRRSLIRTQGADLPPLIRKAPAEDPAERAVTKRCVPVKGGLHRCARSKEVENRIVAPVYTEGTPRRSFRCALAISPNTSSKPRSKRIWRSYIEAARRRQEPLEHVLLYGPPGLGKTPLCRASSPTRWV